jgi:hypothetical protein
MAALLEIQARPYCRRQCLSNGQSGGIRCPLAGKRREALKAA